MTENAEKQFYDEGNGESDLPDLQRSQPPTGTCTVVTQLPDAETFHPSTDSIPNIIYLS